MAADDERYEDGPILVVDDDEHLREALAKILEHEGHTVLQAADGPTAVRMTMEHRPDLLVLDYMMPGMNGEMVLGELQRELHEDTPPALLLTATLEPVERASRMGAVEGLEKPFNVPELVAAVARHRRRLKSQQS